MSVTIEVLHKFKVEGWQAIPGDRFEMDKHRAGRFLRRFRARVHLAEDGELEPEPDPKPEAEPRRRPRQVPMET